MTTGTEPTLTTEKCGKCGGTKSGAEGDCPVCDRTGRPKAAYFETHEAPHCPSCDCGPVDIASSDSTSTQDEEDFDPFGLPEPKMVVHAFGVQRPQDSEPWFLAFSDRQLAHEYPHRCTAVTAVPLYDHEDAP
jgi:hypothetical protein